MDDRSIYLSKAEESVAGAESEFAVGRFDKCANRSYYACFQAAIAALRGFGVQPTSRDGRWGHDLVRARFVGDLINRQKVFSSEDKDTLERLLVVRQIADYKRQTISEIQASRGLRRSRSFVAMIRAHERKR